MVSDWETAFKSIRTLQIKRTTGSAPSWPAFERKPPNSPGKLTFSSMKGVRTYMSKDNHSVHHSQYARLCLQHWIKGYCGCQQNKQGDRSGQHFDGRFERLEKQMTFPATECSASNFGCFSNFLSLKFNKYWFQILLSILSRDVCSLTVYCRWM